MSPAELLKQPQCPKHLSPAIQALWLAHNDQWDAAHQLVQHSTGGDEAWVHAHLHRTEGDHSNANYWYARAGRQPCQLSIREEQEQIIAEIFRRISHTPK